MITCIYYQVHEDRHKEVQDSDRIKSKKGPHALRTWVNLILGIALLVNIDQQVRTTK